MSLDYGRVSGNGEVRIDESRCTACGLCVQVCRGAPLYMEEGAVRVDQTRLFGCIGCGECVAVCPRGCITVEGRDLLPADVLALAPAAERANYAQLSHLLQARRSVRDFKPRAVEPEIVERILAAAATAPMGVPPSEVGVLVFGGPEKVQAFRSDLLRAVRSLDWICSPLGLAAMRLFMSAGEAKMMGQFLAPVFKVYKGEYPGLGQRDWFLYDAPLLTYFYGTPFADAPDPVIAATYAMLAGEALGLGSCMLGIPGVLFQYDRPLRAKYAVPDKLKPGVAVAFGYPAVRYQRGVRRRFARVQVY